jgi:hypothetical protein
VDPLADGRDGLGPVTDQQGSWQSPPPGWGEIVPELGPKPCDHVVRKWRWGALLRLLPPSLSGDGSAALVRERFAAVYHRAVVKAGCKPPVGLGLDDGVARTTAAPHMERDPSQGS